MINVIKYSGFVFTFAAVLFLLIYAMADVRSNTLLGLSALMLVLAIVSAPICNWVNNKFLTK